jgi:hypothetical protein
VIKQNILISTIVRNREDKLDRYYKQIIDFVNNMSEGYDFSITIYENDSTDNSKEKLKSFDYSMFNEHQIQTENINTKYYGSIVDSQRVINYANARNKTIENININKYDWLLVIEPDIVYNSKMVERIITRSELDFKPDIYSGVLTMNNTPYDRWGMRRTANEEWGDLFPDFYLNPIKEFWSTANGVCLYNMEPFKKGLKFNAFNKRLNKYDCDTAVLCEDFREMGYNKIFVNQSILPLHIP